MDYGRMGIGGSRVIVAVPSCTARGTPYCRNWTTDGGLRAPRTEPGSAQLSSAKRDADSQLVSVHIWNRHGMPVWRHTPVGAAASSHPRHQHSTDSWRT